MTTPDHHDPLHAAPLSDEERDLAVRLGRLGPLDGPSPALDAKILAAAHAAAVAHKPRRHRRFAWLGIPPALVTGVGVAAAAVLALGLVWQLRPQPGAIATRGEADAGDELIIMAEPSAARAPAANPPPVPASSAPAAASVERARSAARVADAAASTASAKATALSEADAAAEAGALAEQRAVPAEEKREASAAGANASPQAFAVEPSAAPPPPPAPEPEAASTRRSHETYTTAGRVTAERHGRNINMAAAPAAAAAPASAADEEGSTTLDRVEVTGSRITQSDVDWSQIPVRDDTQLATAEWLERIRARRDGDDLDNARASLKLFKRQYPRVRVPDDLRALLVTDAKQ